jgi:hypothetical protein
LRVSACILYEAFNFARASSSQETFTLPLIR